MKSTKYDPQVDQYMADFKTHQRQFLFVTDPERVLAIAKASFSAFTKLADEQGWGKGGLIPTDQIKVDKLTLGNGEEVIPVKPEIMLSNGGYYHFLRPDPDVVDIPTIAHALAHICRFTGHVARFYSVAEHSVRASYISDEPLNALMHDAAEALVADIATPLKRLLGEAYSKPEMIAEKLIETKYGVNCSTPAVKSADRQMLATEKRDLLPHETRQWKMLELVTPLHRRIPRFFLAGLSLYWKHRFIRRYKELTR